MSRCNFDGWSDVIGEVLWCLSMQTTVRREAELESDPPWHVQPVQFVVQECRQTTVKLYNSSKETHLRATERHLPYEITQCYLQPDTGVGAPLNPSHSSRYSVYLPPKGWKAELTWIVGYIQRWFTCPQRVTYPTT